MYSVQGHISLMVSVTQPFSGGGLANSCYCTYGYILETIKLLNNQAHQTLVSWLTCTGLLMAVKKYLKSKQSPCEHSLWYTNGGHFLCAGELSAQYISSPAGEWLVQRDCDSEALTIRDAFCHTLDQCPVTVLQKKDQKGISHQLWHNSVCCSES